MGVPPILMLENGLDQQRLKIGATMSLNKENSEVIPTFLKHLTPSIYLLVTSQESSTLIQISDSPVIPPQIYYPLSKKSIKLSWFLVQILMYKKLIKLFPLANQPL
jgi:hypothetical protein